MSSPRKDPNQTVSSVEVENDEGLGAMAMKLLGGRTQTPPLGVFANHESVNFQEVNIVNRMVFFFFAF